MSDRKDRIRVHIEGKEFSVVGGQFQEMLAAVKQINGRRFVGELKVWQLPGKAEEIKNQLEISGFQLEGGAPLPEPGATASQPAPARPAAAQSGNDRIRLLVQGHQLAVVGGSFQEMLSEVKNLPGRRFNGETKVWEIPGDPAIIKQLIETAGFQLEGAEKISANPPSPTAESPDFPPFDPNLQPPPYEAPDFSGDDDIPPYEPPDWWDDDNAPMPPMEPPDWWDEEQVELPHPPSEPPTLARESPPPVQPAGHAPPAESAAPGGDQIRIRLGGIPLVVTGGSFQELLAVVKNIPGRRFNSAEKLWDIPADVTLDSLQQAVKAAGFVVKRG